MPTQYPRGNPVHDGLCRATKSRSVYGNQLFQNDVTWSQASRSALGHVMRVIQAELTVYPGRVPLVARIVMACTCVMVLIMVFRIPGAALGAYYPLLLSRESLQATRHSAIRIGSACTLAVVEILLGGILSAGSPFLHFIWVLGTLFAVFYMISSLKFPDAASAVSVQVALAIQVWDEPVSGELRVEHTLYTLLSILIACLVSTAIETIFAKEHPPDAVLSGICQRLCLVNQLLTNFSFSGHCPWPMVIQLNQYATRGTEDLRLLLVDSDYEEAYKQQLSAAIALTGQLVDLSVSLSESTAIVSADDRTRCAILGRAVETLCSSIRRKPATDWIDLPHDNGIAHPILIEIERTVDLIAESLTDESMPIHPYPPATGIAPVKGIVVSDAFQNTQNFRFAVRGTLSALACYLFFMTTGWMALGASIATCFLTALPNTGTSRHKQVLRFGGFILGAGVFGLGAEVAILPNIDNLPEFMLLFLFVVSVGTWVGTSGPRIAYLGFQIVMAYEMVNLNKFALNTSLVPSRDAILGILLGVSGMWLIFDHLWARSSTVSMRLLLLATLRDMARLEVSGETSPHVLNQHLTTEATRINRTLDKVKSLSDYYAFEPFPKTTEETFLNQFVKQLLPPLRACLLVKTGLLQHTIIGDTGGKNTLTREVQIYSSQVLLHIANSIENFTPSTPEGYLAQEQALNARIRADMARGQESNERHVVTEMRLCASLLDLVLHLRAEFAPA